jgi:hypothetical protein
MKKIAVLIVLFFFSSFPVTAQIINVPGDQATIQDGIMAAMPGDVVLVAEGTYYENINFMGKTITVASHYYLDGDERHIKKTIIDGSQPVNPDFASVVFFGSGEDTNSVLCGFTITGGTGTKLIIPGWPEMRQGGGVICLFSGAKVCHNIFKENVIGGSPLCFGGGMVTGPPGFPVSVVVENNVFTKNEVYGIISAGGGGLDNYLPGRITNNKFFNNYVHCSMGIASGGGMGVTNLRDPSALPMIAYGNEVTHNKTECTPLDTIGAISAGMQIYGFNITVSNNTITHNEVICPTDYSYGAGVVLDFPDDRVILKNNIISNNYFSGGGGCLGGGVAIWDGDAKLYNNVISHNMSTYGAGIYVVNDETVSEPEIINNTLTKNEATVAGGGIYYDRSEVTMMNSILWENYAPANQQIGNYMGSIDVTYSNIEGGWSGTGNLDVNPQLISNLCLLNHNSRCIDAGNPDAVYYDPEDPLNSGYALYPAQGLLRNDMGAYGGPGAGNWYELLEGDCFENGKEIELSSSNEEIKIGNYPNPFNPQTTIQLVLPKAGFVSLKIYNVLGQEVATLVSDNLSAGSYKYVWNASNFASGIYIYHLEANGSVMDKKMILMK